MQGRRRRAPRGESTRRCLAAQGDLALPACGVGLVVHSVGSCLRAHLRATPNLGPTFSHLSQGVAPKPGLQRAWTQTRLRSKSRNQ